MAAPGFERHGDAFEAGHEGRTSIGSFGLYLSEFVEHFLTSFVKWGAAYATRCMTFGAVTVMPMA